MGDLVLIRILFITAIGAAAYFLKPFYLEGIPAIAVGVLAGVGVVFFELRLQKVSLRRLIGAAFGSILGILGAYLISLVIGHAMPASDNTIPFLQILVLAWMTYCGLVVGAAKGEMLNLSALGGLFGGEKTTKPAF